MKRLAKVVVRDLPLEPVVERALQQALRDIPGAEFAGNKFEHRLEDAVREAVEDTVSHIVRETVEAEGADIGMSMRNTILFLLAAAAFGLLPGKCYGASESAAPAVRNP